MELGLILLIAAGFLVVAVIGIYNRLVTLRAECKNAFADTDVYLKQRFDLIPNLVEVAKGYAGHERGVFEAIAKARSGILSAANLSERVAAENNLGGAMRGFYAVMENYPQLKADALFIKLMGELSDIENKISAARRFFNNAVADYNASREHFPAVLFAATLGFKPEALFDLGEEQRAVMDKAPSVKF